MGGFSADIVQIHSRSNELPCSSAVSNTVAVIDHAVISMAAGETRVLHIHVTQTGDEDIDRLFELASAPHTNFYEDCETSRHSSTIRSRRSMAKDEDVPSNRPTNPGDLRRRPVARTLHRSPVRAEPVAIPCSAIDQVDIVQR